MPPGGDTTSEADDHDDGHHGSASWCGKVIFFTLFVALIVGVAVVFLETWGRPFKEGNKPGDVIPRKYIVKGN